jgi:cytochrome b subunit of formate dehydrogenase
MRLSRKEFDSQTKLIHLVTAIAMWILIITGTILISPSLTERVSRTLLNRIHIDTGIFLAVFLLISFVNPFSNRFRLELKALWLASAAEIQGMAKPGLIWISKAKARRPAGVDLSRFNLGQKLFFQIASASFVLAVASGFALRTPGVIPVSLQAGAELLHELCWLFLGLASIGHLYHVFKQAVSIRLETSNRRKNS